MTQLTIKTQVKLGMLIGSMETAEGRINSLRANISKMEREYAKVCRGFSPDNQPPEPYELNEERFELVSIVEHFNELSVQVNKLEDKTLDNTSAKIISRGKNSAMVTLTSKDEITGKKTSITRHLKLVHGTTYSGKSLFGHRIVNYELQSYVEAKAA